MRAASCSWVGLDDELRRDRYADLAEPINWKFCTVGAQRTPVDDPIELVAAACSRTAAAVIRWTAS